MHLPSEGNKPDDREHTSTRYVEEACLCVLAASQSRIATPEGLTTAAVHLRPNVRPRLL